MISTPGSYALSGPHCMIKQYDGERAGRCLDIVGEQIESGGQIQVYPCHNKWHQMFGFGNGKLSPLGTIFNSIPTHLVNKRIKDGHDQATRTCLGIMRHNKTRGTSRPEPLPETNEFIPKNLKHYENSRMMAPLKFWKQKQIVTVSCSDTNAFIKFLFVPFIREDDTISTWKGDANEL